MRSLGTLCGLALTLVAAICPAAPPVEPNQRRIRAEGTDGFRALLSQSGLTPVGSVDEFRSIIAEQGGPQQCLLIWFRGADQFGEPLPHGLVLFEFDWRSDFFDRGGALWLATDQPLPDPLRRGFSADVMDTVILARRNAPRYLNRIECPYAHGLPGAVPNLFQARSGAGRAAGLGEVPPLVISTNRPSYLISAGNFTTLGVFRRNEWRYPNNLSEIRDLPFVQVMRHDSGGKILLQADHSVFINSMLLPREPNDNLAFTLNCVDWLISTPEGSRRRFVLFVEDGHIWQPKDYDLMLRAMPAPTPENVAQFLWENRHLLWDNLDLAEDILARLEEDRVLAEIESQDLPGQLVSDLVSPAALRRALFIVGAFVLCFLIGLVWLRSRTRVVPTTQRLSTALEDAHLRNSRPAETWHAGASPLPIGMWGVILARDFLAQLQGRSDPTPDLNQVRIAAGWWHRRRIRRHLDRIRRVAFAPESEAIGQEEFHAVVSSMEFLSEFIDRGASPAGQRN